MNSDPIASGVCLGEQAWLELEEFSRACDLLPSKENQDMLQAARKRLKSKK